MPDQWTPPDLFLEHAGVAIYHCYDDGGQVSAYWYTTDPTDDNYDWPASDAAQFDVRDLPTGGLDAHDRQHHAAIIRLAIETGLLTGEPAGQEPLPVVKIEVRGGVAYIVEQPPGVEVEIIDHDVKE